MTKCWCRVSVCAQCQHWGSVGQQTTWCNLTLYQGRPTKVTSININPIDMAATLRDRVSEFKESLVGRHSVLSEEETKSWLGWCQANSKVKVSPWEIPHGILPSGYSGKIHDVKVQDLGKKFSGPDDKIYNSSPEIRDKVARGNTVLELQNSNTNKTEHDMVVFALKKFTGGMGDEDEEQPENDLVWQRYFTKPLDQVKSVVCMVKENGEAAHVSVRKIEGEFYFIAGSKNVHLLFRNTEDLEKYEDSRFSVARLVGAAWLRQMEALNPQDLVELLSMVNQARLTMIWEILCPGTQHVVDLSYLSQPHLKFLAFTNQYSSSSGETSSLVAFPPDLSLELARQVGLDTANYETITVADVEERMAKVRGGKGYEGEVLYFMDGERNTVGLLKKKTTWYVILRAIREKVSHAYSTYKKNPGGWSEQINSNLRAKMMKRLEEIQRWLGLSDAQLLGWKTLGRDFQNWLVGKLLKEQVDQLGKYSVRGNFPQLWKCFMEEKEVLAPQQVGDLQQSDVLASGEGVGEVPTENVLEEPRASSPYVIVTKEVMPVRPHLGFFIVRNVDLMGRNLKKVLNAQHKTHSKLCNDRKLASIGFHDLDKIKNPRLVYTTCQPEREMTVLGGSERRAISSLLEDDQETRIQKYKHLADHLSSLPVILNGETLISLPPLVNCEETKLSDETEDILVEVTTDQSEDTLERVVSALILQFYHMGIRLNSTRKSVHIERVKLVSPDSDSPTEILFPQKLPDFNKK